VNKILKKIIININKVIAYALVQIIRIFKIPKQNKDLWLIGGSLGRVYADNSASLHRYILKNHPDINVYWIINRNSPDVKKVKKISNKVLYRHSVKSNIYALLANVHIMTHGKMDISDYRKDVFKFVYTVHLGHGVQGFKKIKIHPKLKRTFNRDYDLVLANSKFEKKIKQSWGLDENKVEILGMSRYDELLRKFKNINIKDRKILYMPTWRDWLVNNNNIKETRFYKEIISFLSNSLLNNLLSEENIKLNLYLHINMQEQLNAFDNLDMRNINILPTEIDLQHEIVTSELLITDYSSICWDFLYLDKPVIFYQFDVSEYINYRDSYIDLNQSLFGPTAYRSDNVTSLVKAYLNDEVISKDTEKWKSKMFRYFDDNNSKRIVSLILSKSGRKVL